jgi:hypothetical protein
MRVDEMNSKDFVSLVGPTMGILSIAESPQMREPQNAVFR